MNQAKTPLALAGNVSPAIPGRKVGYPEKITPGFYLSEVGKPDGFPPEADK